MCCLPHTPVELFLLTVSLERILKEVFQEKTAASLLSVIVYFRAEVLQPPATTSNVSVRYNSVAVDFYVSPYFDLKLKVLQKLNSK